MTLRKRRLSAALLILLLPAVALATALARRASAGEAEALALYQEGLYLETAAGDLEAAIRVYERVVREHRGEREIAARAQLRAGYCHELRGDLDRALTAYERLGSTWPDLVSLVAEARERAEYLKAARARQEKLRKIARIEQQLSAENAAGRAKIAEAIGAQGDQDFAPVLVALLKDPHDGVRVAAVRAIEKLGDRGALDDLAQLVEKDESMRVRQAALDAIEKLSHLLASGGASDLISGLDSTDPYQRYRTIQILRKMDVSHLVPALVAHLDDQSPMIRYYMVILLGNAGDASAVPALRKRLADPHAEIRCNAALALKRLGDGSGQAALAKELKNRNRSVRSLAANYLSHFGDATGAATLVENLASDDYYTRKEAIAALARLFHTDHGYDPDAPAERRAAAVERWQQALKRDR